MPITIHNKQYITVAERVQEAGDDFIALNTEVISSEPVVVIKAIVTTKKGTFTGISAANPAKLIEKQNPYEVAETSAVGRALGFAGYGIVEGIASADEMVKSGAMDAPVATGEHVCTIHNVSMKERLAPAGGKYYDHRKEVAPGVWEKCSGTGFKGDMKRVQPEIEPEIDIQDINF